MCSYMYKSKKLLELCYVNKKNIKIMLKTLDNLVNYIDINWKQIFTFLFQKPKAFEESLKWSTKAWIWPIAYALIRNSPPICSTKHVYLFQTIWNFIALSNLVIFFERTSLVRAQWLDGCAYYNLYTCTNE